MTIKIATGCFILGALLAPVAAHAADADQVRAQTTTFVKDTAITTKIKTRLAGEKLSSLALIKVETDRKGAVNLSGKVRTQEDADKDDVVLRAWDWSISIQNAVNRSSSRRVNQIRQLILETP